MLSSSHAIIILWVWHAHLHAIIILWSSIDTSSCYHHLVVLHRHIVMLSSSCELDMHIFMLSSSCCLHRHIVMLSSSWELDRHIVMLSSYIIILWLEVYGLQTKILLEWWTKDERRILETLFKGVSTRCGLRASEITVQISRNHHFIFCSFFPNYAPKRRVCTLFNPAGDSLAASTLFNTASVHAL
jgi:hypothetical protein